MHIRFLLLLMAALAGAAYAADIGVASEDSKSGWVLLEDPLGPGGERVHLYAGDPGLPAPDWANWPHRHGNNSDGSYPVTELWHFDSTAREDAHGRRGNGVWTQATDVLDGDGRETYRRTLHEPFAVNGQVYVVHFDPYKSLECGYSQVLKVDESLAKAGGKVPAGAVVLHSEPFLDAPAVSPDGRHVVFRTFRRKGDGFDVSLQVFSTETWTAVAESDARTFARPVWIESNSLACIALDADSQGTPAQRDPSTRAFVRLLESHTPEAGRLLRLDLEEGELTSTMLLEGAFPPDHYTRSLLADPHGLGLIVARQSDDGVVVESREAELDGASIKLAEYEVFRGMAVSLGNITSAGVRTVGRTPTFHMTRHDRWNGPEPPQDGDLPLPLDDNLIREGAMPAISPDGHGGLIDFGHNVHALLEPVVNPEFDGNDSAQLLRHTLRGLTWPTMDSMRNPRMLARLSKLVRRFEAVGDVSSSVLAFDVEITDGDNAKRGKYIELYGRAGRGGRGRIRMEDNLGGDWLVQAIDGDGTRDGDRYYSHDNVAAPPPGGNMASRPAANAGKVYDDLVTQLETRKLLTLTGVDDIIDNGGLVFHGRAEYRDPASGVTWRTWVYERQGGFIDEQKHAQLSQALAEAIKKREDSGVNEQAELDERIHELRRAIAGLPRERVLMRFVADLPTGSAGSWEFPHALARARMRFAVAGKRDGRETDLAFDPREWVSLPNLTDVRMNRHDPAKDLLLPGVFRIYKTVKGRPQNQLEARAIAGPFEHPKQIVDSGRVRPGYNAPAMNFNNLKFVRLKR